MNIKWISVPALALCIGLPGATMAISHAQPLPGAQNGQYGQYQDRDQDRWGEPPSDYRDAQRQGFHEGVEAARRDFQERRHADADDHDLYKHPPVEGEARRDYRAGFKEGYRRAMEHMRNGDRDRDRDRDRQYEQPQF